MTRRSSRAEYENKRRAKKEFIRQAIRNPIRPGTRVRIQNDEGEHIYLIIDPTAKNVSSGHRDSGEFAIRPETAVAQALMRIRVPQPQEVVVYLPDNRTRKIKFLGII